MNQLSNKQNIGEERTFVFIDAANIIYGCGKAGWKMDFKKLIKYLKTRFMASCILYYAGLDAENKKQLAFYELLQRFGYELKLVPVKRFKDGTRKGDVDSRLSFETMKHFKDYDKAIFLTGDGDHYWLLEYLIENRKKVKVIANKWSTSRDLKKLLGGNFTDISGLKDLLILEQKSNRHL